MTKQKFPRGVQQEWFEGDLCGTYTEQSWKRRADPQPTAPASGPDHVQGPRSLLTPRPLGASCPTSPAGWCLLSGSEGKHLGHLTRSWAHFHPLAGTLFEGRLEALAWEQGWGVDGARRHSPSLHHPRPIHSSQPPACPFASVHNL